MLLSRKALNPAKAGPSVITILAAGALPTAADDGKVDIRGAKGVRVTAGPPGILPGVGGPPTRSSSTDGVEIEVAQDQRITLDRGDPLKPTSQSIALIPGSILIESGTGNVVISSLTKITLAVGANSITIDAKEGITIVGMPYVQINPTGPPPVVPEPLPPSPPGKSMLEFAGSIVNNSPLVKVNAKTAAEICAQFYLPREIRQQLQCKMTPREFVEALGFPTVLIGP